MSFLVFLLPKEQKSKHNQMCNLNFWEGRFQKFYKKYIYAQGQETGKCPLDYQQSKNCCY